MSNSKQTIPCAVFSRPNAADASTADMYVLGSLPDIDWDTWSLINTDQEFIQEFKALESEYDRINIWINSPGGVITDGMAMINTIRNSRKDVHTYNLGLAASMGAVLLISGKTVHAPADSIIMLHTAIGGIMGNKQEIREYADMLEVYESAIVKMVAKKSKLSEEEIIDKYFDGKDHFMLGEAAYEDGLIDVLEDYQVDLPADAKNMSYEQIANHFSTNKSEQTMSLKDWFGTPQSSDEKQIVKIPASELKKLKDDAQEAVNQIEILKGENESLKGQVQNITQERDEVVAKLENATKAQATALSQAAQALKSEQEAHAATQTAFDNFKKESGEEHTQVNHTEDTINSNATEPTSQIRKDEQKAKEQGEKIYAKTKTTES